MTKIYLINLEKSTQRLSQSASRLSAQNIEFERLNAILGKSLLEKEKFAHYSKGLNEKQYYYNLSDAQIGCYLSHRKAWERIASSNEPFGIVLEDDFVLNSDLKRAIETIKGLDVPWDVIKLAAYNNRTRPIAFSYEIDNEFKLVIHNKPMSGGAATAITKEAAQRLLDTTQTFGRPCDTDIQYFWERGVEVMSLLPYPVSQDLHYESTIGDGTNKQHRRPIRRLWLQLLQKIQNHYYVKLQITKFKRHVKSY